MVIKCKMCGGDLIITENSNVCECEFCGTRQTIPNADNEKKMNLFNRANRLRMNSEFDKAAAIYEQIAAEFPGEAEAYWGLCLCAYGIEYVDDPATGEKKPTCHRTLTASIMEDANFEQACDYADSVARKVYRDEAKAIDGIQKDILSIAANEKPYDVFICYKETDDTSSRTEDSVLAQEVYDELTGKGLKVFFSRITLEDKLGVQYEPYIYAALSSAKVMLAIGTAFEYYDAVWVKNEWSRFLGMMKTDRTKTLIPCFRDLDAYDMPKEFKGLQAQDMGKLGWKQDLVRGVMKLCGKEKVIERVETAVVHETVNDEKSVENYIQRVYLFLEDGDTEQAEEYIDKALDVNAKYAPAYVAKVVMNHKLIHEEQLADLRVSIDHDPDWQRALRFANEQQKQSYLKYEKTINENEAYDREQERLAAEQERIAAEQERLAAEQERIAAEKKARDEKYNSAVTAYQRMNLVEAIGTFVAIGDYKESKAYLRKCIDAYRQQLTAKETAKREADPALITAKGNVDQAESSATHARSLLIKADEDKRKADKHEQAITENIRKLSNELSQTRGLFSGKKKRELEMRIDALKRELEGVEQEKRMRGATVETAKAELKKAEETLTKVKAKQERIETEIKGKPLTQWTDEAVISAAARERYTQVGNIVTYGHYGQDNNTSNGKEAIEWIVLKYDSTSGKSLLISRYGLDAHRFDASKYQGWDKSGMRNWLNSTFLNNAFTNTEQAGIVTTRISTPSYKGNSGGSDTQDKLWLLSRDEAETYFKNDEARMAIPTGYAVARYAYRHFGSYSSNKLNGTGCCWWWLRSPGLDSNYASDVSIDGSLDYINVSSTYGSVRPAFWLNLDSADIY